jgi:hypothetical protein
MDIILQIDQPGYGLFSTQGLAVLLGCWVLLSALHPLCLAAARISDIVASVAGPRAGRQATSLHGLDSSAANALGSSFLLRTEALLPGLSLFLIFAIAEFSGAAAHPLAAFYLSSQSTTTIALVGSIIFFLSGALDNMEMSWWKVMWGRLSGLGNALSYGSIVAVLVSSGFSLTATLSLLAAGTALRTLSVLLVRGISTFGLGVCFWLPLMSIAWMLVTAICTVLGPLFFLVLKFCEKASFASLSFGSKREEQIVSSELGMPRTYAIDTLPGMITPR